MDRLITDDDDDYNLDSNNGISSVLYSGMIANDCCVFKRGIVLQ